MAATPIERQVITTAMADRRLHGHAHIAILMCLSRAFRRKRQPLAQIPLPIAPRLALRVQRPFGAEIPATVRTWIGTMMGSGVNRIEGVGRVRPSYAFKTAPLDGAA